MPQRRGAHRVRSVGSSLREYGRGLAGGLVFSVPLLYTMEVWWMGFIAHPERLIIYLLFVFALLLGYNRYAGIRHDVNWLEVVIDSVEELGLGVITAAGTLFLLGRLQSSSSSHETVGKIVVEAGVVAIGFSVGTAQLGADDEGDTGEGPYLEERPPHFMGQVVIAFCGAVLFAANVAPTDEVPMVAVETSPARLIGLALVSIGLGSLILFFTKFTRSERFAPAASHHDILIGSVITYALALASSAVFLWFFGRFDGCSLDISVRQTVVLALPAVLGASAGRLLLQS